MSSPTLLVTGFEPFGGEEVNPSWLAAQGLDGSRIRGHLVVAECLPTVFASSLDVLRLAIERHAPRLVLCVGQSKDESGLCLERVAANWTDARIPDNAGEQPVDLPVIPGAPAGYFSTLPLREALQALHREGIPARISGSAGAFVCNHVFFGLMHLLAGRPGTRGGFVHIPFLPEQAVHHAGQASMGLDLARRGLVRVLEVGLDAHPGPQ